MKKEKTFMNMRLVPEGLKELDQLVTRMGGVDEVSHANSLELMLPDASIWEFDELKDFLEGYSESIGSLYARSYQGVAVKMFNFIDKDDAYAKFEVHAAARDTIQTVFELIEKYMAPHTLGLTRLSCRRPARRHAVVN